jgi:hypothetical protein
LRAEKWRYGIRKPRSDESIEHTTFFFFFPKIPFLYPSGVTVIYQRIFIGVLSWYGTVRFGLVWSDSNPPFFGIFWHLLASSALGALLLAFSISHPGVEGEKKGGAFPERFISQMVGNSANYSYLLGWIDRCCIFIYLFQFKS